MFKKLGIGVVATAVLAMGLVGAVWAQTPTPPATDVPVTDCPCGAFIGGRGFGGLGALEQLQQGAAIADALDISVLELVKEVQAGKTLAQLAEAKKVPVADLVTIVVTPMKTRLQQAVTDGKLTQAQADAQLKDMETRVTQFMQEGGAGGLMLGGPALGDFGKGRGGMRGGPMPGAGMGAPMTEEHTALAEALWMSVTDFEAALTSGKSIATLATEKKVDLEKLVDIVVATRVTEINQAVTDGTLTQAQADAQIALFKAEARARFQFAPGTRMGGGMGPGGMGGHGGRGGSRGGPGMMPSPNNGTTPTTPTPNLQNNSTTPTTGTGTSL